MLCHLLKPDKRYRNYRLRLQPRGERARIVNLQTRDKEVAMASRQRIMSEIEREKEGLISPKPLRDALAKPLPTLLEEFLQELKRQGRRKDYVRQVKNRFPALAKACQWKTMRDVTPKAYLDWRNAQKNLSPRTLNHFLDAARTFFNWVNLVYEIPNPLKRLQKLQVKAKYAQGNRAFTEEELNRLLASAEKWHTLYLLLAFTGLRHGEAKQLIWADVHFGEKPFLKLREEATKKPRANAITPTPTKTAV
jgi:integrase